MTAEAAASPGMSGPFSPTPSRGMSGPSSPTPSRGTHRASFEVDAGGERTSVRELRSISALAFDAEQRCGEGRLGFSIPGAVARSRSESEEKRSFLFHEDVDRNLSKREPAWRRFWTSHQGAIAQVFLLGVYMHFDAGLPILQEVYKKYYGAPTDWIDWGCPAFYDRDACLGRGCNWDGEICNVSPASVAQVWTCTAYSTKDMCVRHACKWRGSACHEHRGMLYTKQTLLVTQNFLEICCIYLMAFLIRGTSRDCFNFQKTFKFSPAGACFGVQAVFGFFAMEEMGADAYSLYSQMSIIILTLTWSIMFKQKLSGSAWVGIMTISLGMIGFNVADASTTTLGLVFILLKICTQCFACIYAEIFIKADSEALYIQMAWMKPVELVVTVVMMFIMSMFTKDAYFVPGSTVGQGEFRYFSAVEAISALGFYHHWSVLTVILMIFNMGDTFMTATVAKKFDSVVKGVAGVVDIVYPTQVFIYFIKPPEYTPLMLISGAAIILGSLNFVMSKGASRREAETERELRELRAELAKTKSALQRYHGSLA